MPQDMGSDQTSERWISLKVQGLIGPYEGGDAPGFRV
jgi:hypothetical protein